MTLTITIEMNGAAFDEIEGGPAPEVARILTEYIKRFEDARANPLERLLRDFNGNTVGQAVVTK